MPEVLYLVKSKIEWVSSVNRLGNYVNSDMTDKTDCDIKCSSFIGYVKVMAKRKPHPLPPLLLA